MRLALIIILGFATGCSINHKSGEYACEKTTDCAELGSDRVCSGGYCISTGVPVDAPTTTTDGKLPPIDSRLPPVCPDQCTSCNFEKQECLIDCAEPGSNCSQPIACPPGWSCEVRCNSNACRAGVNCAGSTACHVMCAGANSCRNIGCGSGPCNIECTGRDSCSQNITCGNSCQCDISCSGLGLSTCTGPSGVPCGDIACDAVDGGCTSDPPDSCATQCN